MGTTEVAGLRAGPRADHRALRRTAPAGGCPGAATHRGLSERELEVLGLVGAGRSNSEIAEDLFISGATVKTHVRHLLAKLDLRDRVQAVVLAHESGLVGRRAGSTTGHGDPPS